MRNLLLALVVLSATIFSATSCGKSEKKTKHGYTMHHYISNSGPKAKFGDVVKIHYDIYIGDSLVQSTRKAGKGEPIQSQIPLESELSEFKGRFPAPYDAIVMMAEGDSAMVVESMDSMQLKLRPEVFKDQTELKHVIVLVDLMSEEEVKAAEAEAEAKQAEMIAKAQAMQGMLPEVEAKVKGLIADHKGGKLASRIAKTPSGVEYVVLEQGSGAKLNTGDQCEVHYYGSLKSGKMFDNSFSRGMPLPVDVNGGRMIKGFDEGIAALKRGDKAIMFIPSDLGYGAAGAGENIPPNSDLVFYVEID